MSPSIERRTGIDKNQIRRNIVLPNKTGIYDAGNLGQIYIDMSRVYSNRELIIHGEIVHGTKCVQLSWKGTGTTQIGPDDYLDLNINEKLGRNPSHLRRERRERYDGRRSLW